MKRKPLIWFATAIILMAWALAASPALAGKVYVMRGVLSAVDLGCNTAVVKVPLSGGKTFTVAGTLAPDVVLKRGGSLAKLQDFKVGEKVTVKWCSTTQGHLILALTAK